MHPAACSGVLAAVLFAASGGIAAPPTAQPEPAIISSAVQLTAGFDDVFNVPMNLFYDIVNIPANWLNAVQEFANSLFFGGAWLVPSATNIWGFDVADPPKVQAFIDMLIPIPELSKPLGEQISGLMAAWLPTNDACDTFWCFGSTNLWDGYFQVPLSQLIAGYTFPDSGPSVVDVHGPVEGAFGFPGTIEGPNGEALFPWAGTTFTLDLIKPISDYITSLFAAPPDSPIVELPNAFTVYSDLIQSVLVAIDFLVPGDPLSPDAASLDWTSLLSLDWDDVRTSFDGLWSDLSAIWTSPLP